VLTAYMAENGYYGENLAPCPYCQSTNVHGFESRVCFFMPGCMDCGAQGPSRAPGTTKMFDKQQALEAWGQRPIEVALRAEIASLKAELSNAKAKE
jgi:hypothetical protein